MWKFHEEKRGTNWLNEVIIQLGKNFSSHKRGSHGTVLHASSQQICNWFLNLSCLITQ